VVNVNSEPHLSVTQLGMYLRCPLQYFFRYVCHMRTPPSGDMTLGRTVHQAIAENYRQKIKSRQDLPLAQLTDAFSQRWEREASEARFDEDEKPGELKDEGVRLLTAYHEGISPRVQPAQVEYEFLVDTGKSRMPIMGFIDLIDDQGYIVDHKTTKRSFPTDAAEKDLQLTAYAMAYRATFGGQEKGVRLDVMVRNKQPKIQQLRSTRTQEDIDRFLRLVKQLERGIRAEAFYPNEGYMCGYCGYGEMCEKW
jgi:CRISPR/Cas system-associated exonuclease Cas4 (RecB family)